MKLKKYTIAVVGLGYVGLPLAVLAAAKGYKVIGIDIDKQKIKLISDHRVPFVENKDKKITHFGKSREDIRADLFKIIEISQTYPAFEGISIHDLDAYLNTR